MAKIVQGPEPGLVETIIRHWWNKAKDFWPLTIFFVVLPLLALIIGGVPLFIIFCGLVGVSLVVPSSREFIGALLDDSRQRHEIKSFIRSWPETCDELGWSSYLQDHHQTTELRTGHYPDLVDFEGLPELPGFAVTLRPLPSQDREKWATMADQLARYAEAPYQDFEEPSPGVLRITVGFTPIAKRIDYDMAEHASLDWDLIPIGFDGKGSLRHWKVSDIPHALVGGSTKGGKGSVLRMAAIHSLLTGWRLVVVNTKGSGEFGWLKRFGVPLLTEIEEVRDYVVAIEKERRERQVIVEAHNVNDWTRLPPELQEPPIMILVDEAASLLTASKSNKEVKAVQDEISYLLTRIAQQGRSAGVHLMLATQRPDSSSLGPEGGQFRNNLDARIGVCSLDADGLRMMFGSAGSDPDIKNGLDGTKGRALATKLTADEFDTYQLQVLYADEEDLNRTDIPVKLPQMLASGA